MFPFEVLDWPSNSPDCSPIETLWRHMKKRLAQYSSVPTTLMGSIASEKGMATFGLSVIKFGAFHATALRGSIKSAWRRYSLLTRGQGYSLLMRLYLVFIDDSLTIISIMRYTY